MIGTQNITKTSNDTHLVLQGDSQSVLQALLSVNYRPGCLTDPSQGIGITITLSNSANFEHKS